jgi:Sugar (and other) transporter
MFVGPWSKFSACDQAKDFLTKQGLSFKSLPGVEGEPVVVKIGTIELKGKWDAAKATAALKESGYPGPANKDLINYPMTLLILFTMLIYVTMVYGPIAAFLVELFPTRIRYTSMSLPYHIGNGWFGGMLPLLATAMVAASGDIYYGLWYPIIVALMTVVIGTLFLRETKDRTIDHDEG